MTLARRTDRLGIHSIGEFHMTVPSLDAAARFYEAFGLRCTLEGGELALRAAGSEHVWGRLAEGSRKRFDGLRLHCFEEDFAPLRSHIEAQGVRFVEPAGQDRAGVWFHDPDGLLLNVRPGPRTMIEAAAHHSPPLPVDGQRCIGGRDSAAGMPPQRLSHIARFTPSVPAQIDFCTRVLGLRLSDRSGDGVAFLHAPHGCDHHLFAFGGGPGPGLHHLSWDVPTVDDVGLGMARLQAAGYPEGWGVGRHVLGSNYFYYARDPWGSWCEFSATMDYIPADIDWVAGDHPPENSVYLWGPPLLPQFIENHELA